MKVARDIMSNVYFLKMERDESVPDYYRKAVTARDIVLKTLEGPINLDGMIRASRVCIRINPGDGCVVITTPQASH